jgi:hypothetical protein
LILSVIIELAVSHISKISCSVADVSKVYLMLANNWKALSNVYM